MTKSTPHRSVSISRRELLAGAGAGAAALFLDAGELQAQATPGRTVVFAHTTVVNVDAVQRRCGARGRGRQDRRDRPDRRSPRGRIRSADVYDGRGKALLPGLINCHAHMAAVLARGFNEDFGFPNSARLAVQPASLLQGEENTLMVTVGGARSDPDRDDHHRGERRRHRPVRGGAGADRPALRVRGIDPRQRERRRPDVAGRARQE